MLNSRFVLEHRYEGPETMDPQSQWCVLWCSSCCRRKKCAFQHKGMGDCGWTSFRDEVDLYTHRQTIVAGVKPQSHRREFYRTDKRVQSLIDDKTLSFDNATSRTPLKDFLELVVRDASDGTSFRECQGARFNSHEIRYLKGDIIYVSSRGDVISFEEFEKLVYTAIVTKNRETCVRSFQLNVRFKSGRVGVKTYVRRWCVFIILCCEFNHVTHFNLCFQK